MNTQNLKNTEMHKRRVFGFGEIVYDIIFKDNHIIKSHAGGSVLNSLINLGIMGWEPNMISSLGNDQLGKSISDHLKLFHVNDNFITYGQKKTKIALAFLDSENNASYQFYDDHEKFTEPDSVPFQPHDIFLFGSQASIQPATRDFFKTILNNSFDSDCIRLYDPNIRPSALNSIPDYKSRVFENMRMSSIVRGSADDFKILFDSYDKSLISTQVFELGCKILIITDAGNPVSVFSSFGELKIEVPEINPISTIGAGDAFNSGIIDMLLKEEIYSDDLRCLSPEVLGKIVSNALICAAKVCQNMENHL